MPPGRFITRCTSVRVLWPLYSVHGVDTGGYLWMSGYSRGARTKTLISNLPLPIFWKRRPMTGRQCFMIQGHQRGPIVNMPNPKNWSRRLLLVVTSSERRSSSWSESICIRGRYAWWHEYSPVSLITRTSVSNGGNFLSFFHCIWHEENEFHGPGRRDDSYVQVFISSIITRPDCLQG